MQSPNEVYDKLWNTLILDTQQIHAKAVSGKRLAPMESKQLLDYLKFVAEVKALGELEAIEKEKHEQKRNKPSNNGRGPQEIS